MAASADNLVRLGRAHSVLNNVGACPTEFSALANIAAKITVLMITHEPDPGVADDGRGSI
jgi:hypothetical protein